MGRALWGCSWSRWELRGQLCRANMQFPNFKELCIAILGVLPWKQGGDQVLFGLTNLIWGNRRKGNRGAGVGRV